MALGGTLTVGQAAALRGWLIPPISARRGWAWTGDDRSAGSRIQLRWRWPREASATRMSPARARHRRARPIRRRSCHRHSRRVRPRRVVGDQLAQNEPSGIERLDLPLGPDGFRLPAAGPLARHASIAWPLLRGAEHPSSPRGWSQPRLSRFRGRILKSPSPIAQETLAAGPSPAIQSAPSRPDRTFLPWSWSRMPGPFRFQPTTARSLPDSPPRKTERACRFRFRRTSRLAASARSLIRPPTRVPHRQIRIRHPETGPTRA